MAELLQNNILTTVSDGRDKHGVYLYRDKSFVAKLDALDHALSLGDHAPNILFVFHDEVYSKLTQEPDIALHQLYVDRAKQLRDSYDHIILLYSGGSDSHEILNVFLKNGIFLDEVQTLYPKKLTEGKIDVDNFDRSSNDIIAESVITTLPELKLLSKISPGTKIRIIDTTDSFFSIDDNYITSYYNHFFNSFYSTQMNTVILDRENVDLATKKKVCLIWGNNKPFVTTDHDDNFYYGFSDVARQFSPWLTESNKSPIHFESFFWTVDAPLIPIKQSHMIMRKMQLEIDQGNLRSYVSLKTKNTPALDLWMKHIIYQYWDENKYQAKMNLVDWHSQDQTIYRYIPKIQHVTLDKMNYYTNKYRSLSSVLDLSRPSLGAFHTRRYNIGKLNMKKG
jgi:hypothetical protein